MRRWIFVIVLFLVPSLASAQTVPRAGIQDRSPRVAALTGASVYVAPGRRLPTATVVIRDGRIEAVGAGVATPADAQVSDMSGHVITAGWIDLDVRVDLPDPAPLKEKSALAGRAWNDSVWPERSAAQWPIDADAVRAYRAAGFTVGLLSPDDKIFAGSGALFALGEDSPRHPSLLASQVGSFISLEHGEWPSRTYPGSRMGAVALVRQTLADAQWYEKATRAYGNSPTRVDRPEVNRSLAALTSVITGEQSLGVRTRDPLELLTMASVLRETPVSAWYLGSGDEYTWIDDIRKQSVSIVVPVDYPALPDLERLSESREVSLRALELWYRAPENAARLERAGIEFALTARGLDQVSDFPDRVREAHARGLGHDQALAAVTTVPAKLLGRTSTLGTVEPGKMAMLTVLDGSPFETGTRVIEVWVDGVRYPMAGIQPDLSGAWQLTSQGEGALPSTTLEISGRRSKPSASIQLGETKVASTRLQVEGQDLNLVFSDGSDGDRFARLSGRVEGQRIQGTGIRSDGQRFTFVMSRAPTKEAAERAAHESGAHSSLPTDFERALPSPLGAFGRTESPFRPKRILVKAASIWTCGPDGIIEDGQMLVEDGRVIAVGKNLDATGIQHVLELPTAHVTPGIVDAHSHTAIIGGVNEGTQAVTAEVRIADVVDPNDVNLYRQLAGGVTVAHLLHGSANPIGGQAATIKLRWGKAARALVMPRSEAKPTIKFALGENVKQSNWGDTFTTRYPQTRMGVEQIFRDSFLAAIEYKKRKRQAARSSSAAPVRVDYELEALVEILDGERWIHCHSYRQDEILMLMRVAEDFGFRMGTFQHILEGYKVAPEMAQHGAAGSSFSDWWAFKFEVYDAIPYNGALLHRAGVLTSFNSDSDELARRLNLEAAKAVKYGGVPPEEALCFVTLNPAKQLGIDHRVGSLEPGKDADFVIWSGSPLSTYSVCLSTWIEGARYFSLEEDAAARDRDRSRREFLVQKALAASFDPGGRRGSTSRAAAHQHHKEGHQCCPRDQ